MLSQTFGHFQHSSESKLFNLIYFRINLLISFFMNFNNSNTLAIKHSRLETLSRQKVKAEILCKGGKSLCRKSRQKVLTKALHKPVISGLMTLRCQYGGILQSCNFSPTGKHQVLEMVRLSMAELAYWLCATFPYIYRTDWKFKCH